MSGSHDVNQGGRPGGDDSKVGGKDVKVPEKMGDMDMEYYMEEHVLISSNRHDCVHNRHIVKTYCSCTLHLLPTLTSLPNCFLCFCQCTQEGYRS